MSEVCLISWWQRRSSSWGIKRHAVSVTAIFPNVCQRGCFTSKAHWYQSYSWAFGSQLSEGKSGDQAPVSESKDAAEVPLSKTLNPTTTSTHSEKSEKENRNCPPTVSKCLSLNCLEHSANEPFDENEHCQIAGNYLERQQEQFPKKCKLITWLTEIICLRGHYIVLEKELKLGKVKFMMLL